MRIGKQRTSTQRNRLDRETAEVIVEPCAPMRTYGISRLQYRPHPASGSAADQTEMTPVFARHQFENGIRLAVPPDPEDESVIAPLHDRTSPHPERNVEPQRRYLNSAQTGA
jgi:hypothetical protein